jgi:hypothetical protein
MSSFIARVTIVVLTLAADGQSGRAAGLLCCLVPKLLVLRADVLEHVGVRLEQQRGFDA